MTLNAVSNPAVIALQAYMASNASNTTTDNNYAINYLSNATATSAVIGSYSASVPASTLPSAPVSVSLLAVFPNLTAPTFLAVYDATSPSQLFYAGTSAGSAMIEISPGGFFAATCGGSLPTTIYLANPSASLASQIVIVVMSN